MDRYGLELSDRGWSKSPLPDIVELKQPDDAILRANWQKRYGRVSMVMALVGRVLSVILIG